MSNSSEVSEGFRNIAADYQEVFTSTPAGQRVFKHLMLEVLRSKAMLCPVSNAPPMAVTTDRAVYLAALRDASIMIEAIMEFDFRQKRPVVHHSRPAGMGMSSPNRYPED